MDSKSSSSLTKSIRSTNNLEPVYQVKLLSALRTGDPALIQPFLAEICKDRQATTDVFMDTGAAALHLAVRCASVQTVSFLLAQRAISPNGVHPPGSGTTALHLASSLGRTDVVSLLLEQDDIDDTIRDSQGRTAKDIAKNKDILRAIADSHTFLNASYRSQLRSYILSPPTEPPSTSFLRLLQSSRIKHVNLSYLDDDSGLSLLHEAAKRKDLRFIELAVRAGADTFVRSRRGKLAYEISGKDDRVRVFLRQLANHDNSLIQSTDPSTEPPPMKGYLNKYANVAKGYNTRWFVLKGGVMSYYCHQENETVASRGSISMRTATLKVTDRFRFEVQSLPARGYLSSGVQKWYMKANHPVEATRWVQAITQSIGWYRNQTSDLERRQSGDSDSSGFKSKPSTYVHSIGNRLRKSVRLKPETETISYPEQVPLQYNEACEASPDLVGPEDNPLCNSSILNDGDDEDDEENSSSPDSENTTPPHGSSFELHGNSLVAQIELTQQMLSKLSLSPDTRRKMLELRDAIQESFSTVQLLCNEHLQMERERENWWKRQLYKERTQQSIWEESLATVIKEGETLEEELRKRSRKRGSRVFGPSAQFSHLDGFRSISRRSAVPRIALIEETPRATETSEARVVSISQLAPSATQGFLQSSLPPPVSTQSSAIPIPNTILSGPLSISPTIEEEFSDEDEFFDAIDMNNLPNLIVHKSFFRSQSELALSTNVNCEPYQGYANLRGKLNLTDERPSTSLWSVLKHSIGKDLTKISFPVFFNEPTSMLQRMAEDMEFSECLDAASLERDPLRRLAFVGAFAMSNYSSTIGRIAKPFNPMLSETFEYVRLDRKYRYMSEQVSHHPPISACWAESPSWNYYGEVDAQNKFMGKSFEIRPTGVAHAELLIPEELGPKYPKAPGKKGLVAEHYSWKKVTTNVSGFILGSPTIDHYGDMIITNHRTGDKCILTFKPRGWRGRDAYEIAGQVIDANESVQYDIAGRWNSQLVAKHVGAGGAALHPDTTVSGPGTPAGPEYILLWRNSDKPPNSPFNLTPFAITLNDCAKGTLKPYLCPTDCRLRPDQRAFENGKFETANTLKQDQEERQRAIRKAREEGRLRPHMPRWFRAETDGDTGERVWTPSRVDEVQLEYWAERERVWREGGNVPWRGVDSIFIEVPDRVVDK